MVNCIKDMLVFPGTKNNLGITVRVEALCSLNSLNPSFFRICLLPEMQKRLGDKKGCVKMMSIVGLRRTNMVNWWLKDWLLVLG